MDDIVAPLDQATTVRREGFTLHPRALTARQVAQCRVAAAHSRTSSDHSVQPQPGPLTDILVPEFALPSFEFLHAGAPWMSTARALLGDDCVLLAGGVVDINPGAAAGEV